MSDEPAPSSEEELVKTDDKNNDVQKKCTYGVQIKRVVARIEHAVKHRWEACKNQQNARENYKIAIETLTLLAVISYGLVAYRQWREMKTTVQEEVMTSRPVVFGWLIRGDVQNGHLKAVDVTAKNWGKSTALNVSVVGQIVGRTAKAPTPHDPRCSPRFKRHPPDDIPETAVAPKDRDEGYWLADNSSLVKGNIVYIVGCMYYRGLDGNFFYSDYCVTWEGENRFRKCTDPHRNYVK